MVTTTSYGSWCTRVCNIELSPEYLVSSIMSGADSYWLHLMERSGRVDLIAQEFRDEINNALPPGMSFHASNEFIGPADRSLLDTDGYPVDEDGDLDIKAIVDDIDVDSIIERFDIDYNRMGMGVAMVDFLVEIGYQSEKGTPFRSVAAVSSRRYPKSKSRSMRSRIVFRLIGRGLVYIDSTYAGLRSNSLGVVLPTDRGRKWLANDFSV